ncbi:HAD-like domain-containing protein [Cantharellus anzutake]|uniref:HAD-like domain-containing protein n=1 Tax=Cantharellus anzutake TaxID=1750568 RepID=UPI001908B0C9|nr:HAD-like domain-containing protein [Cantharellus anzutake]KAF8333148.1 HAD-like domain-containing protein [Cantharellus anzutake]
MFAPLNPDTLRQGLSAGLPTLKGIVFDMDGTLCEPQTWMFRKMREALGIGKSVDILDHIESLLPPNRVAAEESIRAIEREAMASTCTSTLAQMKPQLGLVPLMKYLTERGICKAICTRNFDVPVNHLLQTFLPEFTFSPIMTRTFKPNKPHPACILHIQKQWAVQTSEMMMIGDSIEDMVAGRNAGALTVLLLAQDGHNAHLADVEYTDCVVTKLDHLIPLLEEGKLTKHKDRTRSKL